VLLRFVVRCWRQAAAAAAGSGGGEMGGGFGSLVGSATGGSGFVVPVRVTGSATGGG
jgi:hypothetical protein